MKSRRYTPSETDRLIKDLGEPKSSPTSIEGDENRKLIGGYCFLLGKNRYCKSLKCGSCPLIQEHFSPVTWRCSTCLEGVIPRQFWEAGSCEKCGTYSPVLICCTKKKKRRHTT